jgi:hypothetical protein
MKFLLLLVVIAMVAFVLLRKQGKGGEKKAGRKHLAARNYQVVANNNKTRFRATTIVAGDNTCQAALVLQDKLFLDSDHNTPSLPLADCTQASDCYCKYTHQDDRRCDGDDRRAPHKLAADLYSAEGGDRREGKRGRRSSD